MKRPIPALAVAAIALTLLAGCGKEEKSGSPCRDAYIEKIDEALDSLEQAPPETDFEAALGDVLDGTPEECEELVPGMVEAIYTQVLDERADRLAKLEGKFHAPTESPEPDETGSPSEEESESPSPEPSEDESSSASSSEEESPSPEPSD